MSPKTTLPGPLDTRRASAGSSSLPGVGSVSTLPNRPHACEDPVLCSPDYQSSDFLLDDDIPPVYVCRRTPHQERVLEDLNRRLMIEEDDPLVRTINI